MDPTVRADDGSAHEVDPAATGTGRARRLGWLMLVFGVLGPLAVVAGFSGQIARTGEVSHWPWSAYGFFGWWLFPLSLLVATVCGLLRDRGRRSSRVTVLLGVLTLLTTVALFFNP